MATLVLAPRDSLYEKVVNNIAEIKAQGGVVVAVGTEEDEDLASLVDHMISIPKVPDHLYQLMESIPLQFLRITWLSLMSVSRISRAIWQSPSPSNST